MNEPIRTMDQMDRYLCKDGATVERRYQSDSKRYKFKLKKDNFEKEYFFYYPTDCTDSAKYEQMTNAAKGMLEDFNLALAARPGGKRNDGLDAFSYVRIPSDLDITQMYPVTMIAHKPLAPTNVIFNGPATIVFWNDGTKTIVKCSDGDEYDPEKGLAMAYSKKLFGNKGNYGKHFKKWLPKEEKPEVKPEVKISLPVHNVSSAVKAMRKLNEALKKGGRGM